LSNFGTVRKAFTGIVLTLIEAEPQNVELSKSGQSDNFLKQEPTIQEETHGKK
jgi:hypothetical protein